MSYEDRTGRLPDFIARYRFYPPEEGGKRSAPRQGYRCDFMYDGDALEDGVYMIWPEFVGGDGDVLPADAPAEHAFGGNDEVLSERSDGFEKALGIGERVPFEDGVALLVEDAEEHRLGV